MGCQSPGRLRKHLPKAYLVKEAVIHTDGGLTGGNQSLSGMESIPVLGEPGVRYWRSSGVRKATMWGKREVLEHGSDAKQEVSP